MTLGDRIVVMNDGASQQVGSPLQVYNEPTNRFVAGFVGTPPMNFVDGKVVRDDGLWFDGADFRLRIPADDVGRVEDHVDQAVVLGVRPEAIALENEGRFAGQDNQIPVTVKVIEPLGEKMDVFTSTPTHPRLIARVDARSELKAGAQIHLHLDMKRVHLFEPGETGANLTAEEAVAGAAAG